GWTVLKAWSSARPRVARYARWPFAHFRRLIISLGANYGSPLWPDGALSATIRPRFANATSFAARKIARHRRFPFRVSHADAIRTVTGGPSGHPIRPLLREQGVTMARPLTKTEADGTLYRRPAPVEAQVDEAVQLKLPDLRRRLLVTDKNDANYLRS